MIREPARVRLSHTQGWGSKEPFSFIVLVYILRTVLFIRVRGGNFVPREVL